MIGAACWAQVETAVRMRHIPTGMTVKCSEQRTQGANKTIALAQLKVRRCCPPRLANGGFIMIGSEPRQTVDNAFIRTSH